MGWTNPITWAANAVLTAAQLNTYVRDDLNFLYNAPSCRVYHNGAQSITSGTIATLAFNSERFDTDTMHDTVTNNSRITIKTAGTYIVGCCVDWSISAAGRRLTFLKVNGTTEITHVEAGPDAGQFSSQNANTVYAFAVNDYIQVLVYQDSGGGLNINPTGNWSPEFWAVRVAA